MKHSLFFITRKNGKIEKEVFTINLLFLYYPILPGFLLFFWNDNRLLPLCHSSSLRLSESLAKTYVILRRKASKNLHLMASGNSSHSLEMTIIWDPSYSVYRPQLTSFFLFAPRLCPNKNVLYGTWLGAALIRHIFVQERQ